MMKQQIEQYQKKLRLSSSLLDIYLGIEASNQEEFLLKLLKTLYEDREQKRKIRNLNDAGFKVVKTLSDYDFSQVRFPQSLHRQDLEELDFVQRKENLILYGAVGSGKTHLAVALGVKAIQEGQRVVYYRIHELIHQLECEEHNKASRGYKKIEQADLLILDEWGYLPLHQEGARLLFDVISRCYETKSMIITTNMEFSKWKGFLFDEMLTTAIVDRLVHHSHMLIFQGQSYRMNHSLMK